MLVGLAAASIVLFGLIAGSVLACVLVSRAIARKEAELRQELAEIFHQLVDPPDENTPSALGAVGDHLATMFAARLVQQVEVRLRGSRGGIVAREHDAEIAAGSADLIQSQPWLGLVAGLLPRKLQRQLLANPGLVGSLAKIRGGSAGPDNGQNSGGFQLPL